MKFVLSDGEKKELVDEILKLVEKQTGLKLSVTPGDFVWSYHKAGGSGLPSFHWVDVKLTRDAVKRFGVSVSVSFNAAESGFELSEWEIHLHD